MATKAEINTVYAAGLVQGIALFTFPAASTIFTSPSQYGLSNTQYGFLFLPQVVTAITTSVLGGSLAARFGTKRVFLAGLVADLASMALLIISVFFTSSQPVAYGLLLAPGGPRNRGDLSRKAADHGRTSRCRDYRNRHGRRHHGLPRRPLRERLLLLECGDWLPRELQHHDGISHA